MSDKLVITVTNLKTKASRRRIIPIIDDSKRQNTVNTKMKNVTIGLSRKNSSRITSVETYHEENFLRNLYRNIEELTHKVNKK